MTFIPLPVRVRQHAQGVTQQTDSTPNLSLLYYKMAGVFATSQNQSGNTTYEILKDRSSFLKIVVARSGIAAYAQSYAARRSSLEKIGVGFSLTTSKRLVFGVGYSHPLEIGFTFDWTTGLPVIPGSSLKGVARSFASDNKEACGVDDDLINKIFGPQNSVEAGRIIFFPAYPCLNDGQKFLDLDVMTPHYGPYYRDPSKNPPGDWHNPVPLHFLTVPVGVRYCFRLADRRNLAWKEADSDLLNKAKEILSSALIEHGVGAKTSVDYGYFT